MTTSPGKKCIARRICIVLVALLSAAGCGASGGAAAVSYDAGDLDAGGGDLDAQPNVDGPPSGCVVTWMVPGTTTACRAGWRCDDGTVLTYGCSEADGGARCFCIEGTNVTRVLDQSTACGKDEATLITQVPQLCGWTFLASDDGGAP